MNASMRRAAIRIVVIAVVATCIACPLIQMFDHWDHAEKSGKDTESTAMIVALAVGLAIPAAGLVFKTPGMAKQKIELADFLLGSSTSAFANAPVPVSQPPPVLRI